MVSVFTRRGKKIQNFSWLGFSRVFRKFFYGWGFHAVKENFSNFFSIFLTAPNFYFSNQIVYEAPKTDDQNEIRFVKLEDEEYNLLRNKMLRNIAPKLSSGHSWMSRDCPRPFSEI